MQLPRSDHQVFTSFRGKAGQSSRRTSYSPC
ncbi:hypothetical protein MTR67_027168 [Solanum verrucosum]|uniref:Uncharacterized protein n=1 Tax=Solanum verrucosum TaxID=315347 RepID=A0AAF0R488_SOLVR|nr:hypothetical protein MTR67_027168 [Solanum verrucosum]